MEQEDTALAQATSSASRHPSASDAASTLLHASSQGDTLEETARILAKHGLFAWRNFASCEPSQPKVATRACSLACVFHKSSDVGIKAAAICQLC